MDLRPYQVEALAAIEAQFERQPSTLLVLGTGLGKTVTFSELARRFVVRGQRVLVVAHRGELLEQAAATLARFGLTVALEQGDRRADRDIKPEIVIASVQTLRGKRLLEFAPEAFGLVVVDEAHHATAASYRTLLAHFTAAKVLGVTATPDRADGVGLRNVFASCAYRMDLSAGIAGGWLAPIELRTVLVKGMDLSQVRTVAGDLAAGELERELLRDQVLHEVAAPLAELAQGRQTLAFVAGVQQAHALAEVLQGYGVTAAAVDGSMPGDARTAVLAGYRAGRVQVVCNAMLWTEGFDAPETSCVALVRPTRSRSLLVQMIGRGTRKAEGKGSCLVLDFVPGRASAIRLASPVDVLAGEDLPESLADRVRALSQDTACGVAELIARIRAEQEARATAKAEKQRAEQATRSRLVREVGVVYAAPRIDVRQLLDALSDQMPPQVWGAKPATPGQKDTLRQQGFDVPDNLSIPEARALFDVLDQRRAAGLCTLKQAKKLRTYGLRDDVSFELARTALDAIAANGWRPPSSLLSDPRFVRVVAA